jgi:hypothetical protein
VNAADHVLKRFMYAFRTSVKTKHVDAFVRYNSPAKLRNLLRVELGKRLGRTHDFGLPYIVCIEPTNHCNLSWRIGERSGLSTSGKARSDNSPGDLSLERP